MRSNVVRKSRGLLRTLSLYSSVPSPKKPTAKRFVPHSHEKRLVSTDNSSSSSSSSPPPEEPAIASPSPPPEDPDKSKPKRLVKNAALSQETIQLPEGLHILWTPDELPSEPLNPSSLPPPEILEEALDNLLVTLHPQTQHRAVYPSPLTSSVEPTLALYCPIEGYGDAVIDSTVVELARKTGSEVLVLDGVQLAAGEWGYFGSAANSLKLPRNPLHFASTSSSSSPSKPTSVSFEEDDENEPDLSTPQQMMFTVLAPSRRGGSTTTVIKPKRSAPPSKVKVFFDSLINLPPSTSRPRIIYIRDFTTLASTSSAWFPFLRDAVSQRRKGALTRDSSPISNPMTIILGMSPPLSPPPERPHASGGSGLMSILLNRSASSMQSPQNPKADKTDWTESHTAEQAREKRLQQRLKSWEKGEDLVMDEYNKYSLGSEGGNGRRRPEIIVVEGGSAPPIPIPMPGSSGSSSDEGQGPSIYRSSVLVPSVRSLTDERDYRILRRREINELTMRMAVGEIGGALEVDGTSFRPSFIESPAENVAANPPSENLDVAVADTSNTALESSSSEDVALSSPANQESPPSPKRMWDDIKMWESWGRQLEPWSTVRQIADRAIGRVVASTDDLDSKPRPSLDRTPISWPDIHRAFGAVHGALDYRKTWLRDSLSILGRKSDDEQEGGEEMEKDKFDEVVENVKSDPELDTHEQRLLSCIVDSATMPTSFSHVHLPPHTIDSIRSIVSLPLLHPEAFQTGILKMHGMTGCLLFGPPGVGKTLVVRALAREAGCRMMVISPSDVMDMYVGEGEKLVHAVFSLARRIAPCVIFLDEIDALFSARMSARESGSSIAHRGIITEFMQEMDGLKTSREDNVIVIGATNRPFDLDDAVLRRLPRRLLVDLPGVGERKEILKILLRDEVLSSDVDLDVLSKQTESFSGSDLKHLCVSAALDAVKEGVKLPWLVSPETPNTSEAKASEQVENGERATEDKGTSVDLKTSTASGAQTLKTPTLNEAQKTEEASSSSNLVETESEALKTSGSTPEIPFQRVLSRRHFDKALKEITPSSSESLGSLSDLRKWNEEFGEGRKDRKRKSIWGRGRFGFTDRDASAVEEGRVVNTVTPSSADIGSGNI